MLGVCGEFCAGRIWAGHNIIKFDCVRIRDAFAAIKQTPPEPKGTIDSLILLTQKFGKRAGNMKVSSCHKNFVIVVLNCSPRSQLLSHLSVLRFTA
jgi:DNA polymerase III epsilon subunit-like protein